MDTGARDEIVVGIDPVRDWRLPLSWAVDEARRRRYGLRLVAAVLPQHSTHHVDDTPRQHGPAPSRFGSPQGCCRLEQGASHGGRIRRGTGRGVSCSGDGADVQAGPHDRPWFAAPGPYGGVLQCGFPRRPCHGAGTLPRRRRGRRRARDPAAALPGGRYRRQRIVEGGAGVWRSKRQTSEEPSCVPYPCGSRRCSSPRRGGRPSKPNGGCCRRRQPDGRRSTRTSCCSTRCWPGIRSRSSPVPPSTHSPWSWGDEAGVATPVCVSDRSFTGCCTGPTVR